MPSSPLPGRPHRAVAQAPSLFAQVAPPCLFVMALGLAVVVGARSYKHFKQPKRIPAKEGVDVFSLARTPTIAAGHERFAILGLGQDPESGRQIVWVRSIDSNRIGGFAVGDTFFDGDVQVASIESTKVTLIYENDPIDVPLEP